MADQSSRYISNLTRDTYALILAGGKGSRLHELTNWRANRHFISAVNLELSISRYQIVLIQVSVE